MSMQQKLITLEISIIPFKCTSLGISEHQALPM